MLGFGNKMFDDDVKLSVVFHNNPSGTSQSGYQLSVFLSTDLSVVKDQPYCSRNTAARPPSVISLPLSSFALSLEREGQSSAQVQQTGACSSVSFYIFNL